MGNRVSRVGVNGKLSWPNSFTAWIVALVLYDWAGTGPSTIFWFCDRI